MANSREYPYPTMDYFHVLTPRPPLACGNSRMFYPPCSPKFIIVNLLPLWNFRFFVDEHFFTGQWRFEPGSKLYPAMSRKTYHEWPRLCKLLKKSGYNYKNKHHLKGLSHS